VTSSFNTSLRKQRIRILGPDCATRLVLDMKSESIADTHPQVAEKWGRNGPFRPEHFTQGSGRIANWECADCGEHWNARIQTVTSGSGCPYCQGRKVSVSNSIAAVDREAAEEFDIANNDGKRPEEVYAYRRKGRCNFRCRKNSAHGIYSRTPYVRIKIGRGCPQCMKDDLKEKLARDNCLTETHKLLAKIWHPTKNSLRPYEVSPGSHKRVYFACEAGHEEYLRVCDKLKRPECRECKVLRSKEISEDRSRPRWKARSVSKPSQAWQAELSDQKCSGEQAAYSKSPLLCKRTARYTTCRSRYTSGSRAFSLVASTMPENGLLYARDRKT